MKRLLVVLGFLALSAGPAVAQQEHFEFSVGGSFRAFQQTETSDQSRIGMPGWYFAGVFNIHRFRNFLGVQLEGTGSYRGQGVVGNTSIYTAQIGPRIYPIGHHKLTPYGEVLFGVGYYRNDIPAYGGFQPSVYSYTGDTWEAGGGMEMNIKHHWGLRLMQFDFGQTHFFSKSERQTNYRASIGITYRFNWWKWQ